MWCLCFSAVGLYTRRSERFACVTGRLINVERGRARIVRVCVRRVCVCSLRTVARGLIHGAYCLYLRICNSRPHAVIIVVVAIRDDIAFTYFAMYIYIHTCVPSIDGTRVRQGTLASRQRRRKVFYDDDIIITVRRACFRGTRSVNAQINYCALAVG
jgi:hypothetical protein